MLEETLAPAMVGAHPRDVGVELRLDPLACVTQVDKVQVQQVLLDLIRNALDATAAGNGLVLVVATAPATGGTFEVSVADTGPGMLPLVLDRLFQPFVATKSDGMGGTVDLPRDPGGAWRADLGRRQSGRRDRVPVHRARGARGGAAGGGGVRRAGAWSGPKRRQASAARRCLSARRFWPRYPPRPWSRSSRGLGQCPLTAPTGVRIPYGTPSIRSLWELTRIVPAGELRVGPAEGILGCPRAPPNSED